MSEARLPAHIEVTGLIRAAEARGGFGMVLAKGERDAGTLLVICCHSGTQARAYERMPQPDGTRKWTLARQQDVENPHAFSDFCDKRKRQDADLWIVELDMPDAEQLIGLEPLGG
jgi:hypothetical protein